MLKSFRTLVLYFAIGEWRDARGRSSGLASFGFATLSTLPQRCCSLASMSLASTRFLVRWGCTTLEDDLYKLLDNISS